MPLLPNWSVPPSLLVPWTSPCGVTHSDVLLHTSGFSLRGYLHQHSCVIPSISGPSPRWGVHILLSPPAQCPWESQSPHTPSGAPPEVIPLRIPLKGISSFQSHLPETRNSAVWESWAFQEWWRQCYLGDKALDKALPVRNPLVPGQSGRLYLSIWAEEEFF